MKNIIVDGKLVTCPLCNAHVNEASGDGFEVMHCVNCNIVYDVKRSDEEWNYVPSLPKGW